MSNDVSSNLSLLGYLFYNGKILSQSVIELYQVCQFVEVGTNIGVYNFFRLFMMKYKRFQKIKSHIGIKHTLLQCIFTKAIIVIIRFHHGNYFIYRFFKYSLLFIICQHFTQFLLTKANQIIKPRISRYISSDIKSTCDIIHRHRTHPGNKQPFKGSPCSCCSGFYHVKEATNETFTMRCFSIKLGTVG